MSILVYTGRKPTCAISDAETEASGQWLWRPRAVEFVEPRQNIQGRVAIGTRGQHAKPGLRVVCGQRRRAQFFDELVEAHSPRCRQLLQSQAPIFGKADPS